MPAHCRWEGRRLHGQGCGILCMGRPFNIRGQGVQQGQFIAGGWGDRVGRAVSHVFCILRARQTAPVRTRANAAPAAAPASSRTSLTAPVAGAVSVAPLYRSCVRQSTSACASRFPSCCRAIWPVHSRKWTGAGPSRRRIVSILPKSAPRQGSFPRFSGAGAKGRWAKGKRDIRSDDRAMSRYLQVSVYRRSIERQRRRGGLWPGGGPRRVPGGVQKIHPDPPGDGLHRRHAGLRPPDHGAHGVQAQRAHPPRPHRRHRPRHGGFPATRPPGVGIRPCHPGRPRCGRRDGLRPEIRQAGFGASQRPKRLPVRSGQALRGGEPARRR